jgi:hypothetical protein
MLYVVYGVVTVHVVECAESVAIATGEGMHSHAAASTCTHMMVHALAKRGRALRADRLAILCVCVCE